MFFGIFRKDPKNHRLYAERDSECGDTLLLIAAIESTILDGFAGIVLEGIGVGKRRESLLRGSSKGHGGRRISDIYVSI